MNLVTVTYYVDLRQMLIQAESINQHITGITHWVVVNSRFNNMDRWYKLLSPYYTKNKLKLIKPPTELITPWASYLNQQLLKLWVSSLIQDDYLILDSKNFYVNPTDTSIYSNQIASNGFGFDTTTETYPGTCYKEFTIKASKFIGNASPRFIIPGIGTPYRITWKNMSKINIDDFVKWSKSLIEHAVKTNPGNPSAYSEFIFYAQLMDQQEIDTISRIYHDIKENNTTIWNQDLFIAYTDGKFSEINKSNIIDALNTIRFKPETSSMGFHRYWLLTHPEFWTSINEWLKTLGIKTKLKICRPSRWI